MLHNTVPNLEVLEFMHTCMATWRLNNACSAKVAKLNERHKDELTKSSGQKVLASYDNKRLFVLEHTSNLSLSALGKLGKCPKSYTRNFLAVQITSTFFANVRQVLLFAAESTISPRVNVNLGNHTFCTITSAH